SKAKIASDDVVTVSVTVSNTGDRAGDEIVQLYIRDQFSRVTRPVKELKGFQRVSLMPDESQQVQFEITPDMLAYYNLDMEWQLEPGDFTVMLGGSSRDSELQSVTLNVTP
ncbi:MAG: fibronectin type III-like domain-contianing protein, partial [Pseudomonadales bacterium]|nr:fibronectin type III-like domain-contianing protein [Pseudomonadales bacterium]